MCLSRWDRRPGSIDEPLESGEAIDHLRWVDRRARSVEPVGSTEKPKGFKNWVTVKLDAALVQRWIDKPQTNRGVLLMDPNEGVKGGGAAYYRACDFEDPNMRPRLVLAFGKKVTPAPKCTPDGCPAP